MKELEPPERIKDKIEFALEDGLPVVNDPEWSDTERAYQAQKLKTAGFSNKEIATICGYDSGQMVAVILNQYYQRARMQRSDEWREQILDLEMARSEELIKAYWPTAFAGDVKHAEFVLKTMAYEAKLAGLDDIHTKAQQSSKTIIIASDENYAEQLREFVEDDSE